MNGPQWIRCEGSREQALFRRLPEHWRYGVRDGYGFCSVCGRRLHVFSDGTISSHKFVRGDQVWANPHQWDWRVKDVGYPYPTAEVPE